MKLKPKNKLVEHLSQIEDPRIERSKRHKLIDVLTIAILAVICGADSWVGMESFAQAKLKWLKRILELPNGVPSHDTFARVFARLNPEQFQQCFLEWVRSLVRLSGGEVIAMDGKTLRQSYDSANGKVERETRYYISSLASDAHKLSQAVRSHWQVENSLHWVLDLAFLEDSCRIRKDDAPENLTVVRHVALNLLNQETTAKLGVKNKRLRADWDEHYLLKVLLA